LWSGDFARKSTYWQLSSFQHLGCAAVTEGRDLVAAIESLRTRLGRDAVLDATEAERAYGASTTGSQRMIVAGLKPKSVEDVQAIVVTASQHGLPLYPFSTGHNWGYGCSLPVRDGCVVVDLSGLKGIEMDAEQGLVTLEPGVTQGDLSDYLEANGLPFLVPTTGAGPRCSLIGNVLERGYGITPYADHFGAMMGIEAVLADGSIYRSPLGELGGDAVDRGFKWKVGPYLDGLFAQSNFGIVTRMTIALASRPERIQAYLFGVKHETGLDRAVLAVQKILRSLGGVAGSINLMNTRRVLSMSADYPREHVGPDGILPAAVVTELAGGRKALAWTGIGALYGTKSVVQAARAEVRRILAPLAGRVTFISPELASRLHRFTTLIPPLRRHRLARRAKVLDLAMQVLAGRPSEVALHLAYWTSGIAVPYGREMDPARDGCGLIWYPPLIPMRPERVRVYVNMVERVCTAHRIEPLITLTSLSDRCFDSSVPLLFRRNNPDETAAAQACYRALLEAGRAEGFLPYRMAIDAMDWVIRPETPYWQLVSKIKSAFDPTGIIAPGRYTPLKDH
jgi:4-cresol dehydrogenase (hydroxylating)